MLGLHWIADMLECDRARLTRDGVREALIEVTRVLGLHAVGLPELFEHTAGAGESSIAGIVLLSESHASCHAFPDARAVHLDVFSCRAVDFSEADRFAERHFGGTLRSRVVERGGAAHAARPTGVIRRVR